MKFGRVVVESSRGLSALDVEALSCSDKEKIGWLWRSLVHSVGSDIVEIEEVEMNDAHIGRDAVLMFSRSTDAFDPLARPLYQAFSLINHDFNWNRLRSLSQYILPRWPHLPSNFYCLIHVMLSLIHLLLILGGIRQ